VTAAMASSLLIPRTPSAGAGIPRASWRRDRRLRRAGAGGEPARTSTRPIVTWIAGAGSPSPPREADPEGGRACGKVVSRGTNARPRPRPGVRVPARVGGRSTAATHVWVALHLPRERREDAWTISGGRSAGGAWPVTEKTKAAAADRLEPAGLRQPLQLVARARQQRDRPPRSSQGGARGERFGPTTRGRASSRRRRGAAGAELLGRPPLGVAFVSPVLEGSGGRLRWRDGRRGLRLLGDHRPVSRGLEHRRQTRPHAPLGKRTRAATFCR
jgi:hypothetical protein